MKTQEKIATAILTCIMVGFAALVFAPMFVTSHQTYSGKVALVEYNPALGGYLSTHSSVTITFYNDASVSCVVSGLYGYLSEYKPLVNQTVTITATTWPGLWLQSLFNSRCVISGAN